MDQLIDKNFLGSTEKEEMLSLLRAARAKLSSALAPAALAPASGGSAALAPAALAPAALAPAQNVVRVDVKPDATSEGTP